MTPTEPAACCVECPPNTYTPPSLTGPAAVDSWRRGRLGVRTLRSAPSGALQARRPHNRQGGGELRLGCSGNACIACTSSSLLSAGWVLLCASARAPALPGPASWVLGKLFLQQGAPLQGCRQMTPCACFSGKMPVAWIITACVYQGKEGPIGSSGPLQGCRQISPYMCMLLRGNACCLDHHCWCFSGEGTIGHRPASRNLR